MHVIYLSEAICYGGGHQKLSIEKYGYLLIEAKFVCSFIAEMFKKFHAELAMIAIMIMMQL